jgi:hypothetical protein
MAAENTSGSRKTKPESNFDTTKGLLQKSVHTLLVYDPSIAATLKLVHTVIYSS